MKNETSPEELSWKKAVARHQKPQLGSSIWQLANSVVPYLALWGLMAWTSSISYWITLALAVPAAGFLVRIFIIFHDSCHGSFFKSRRANRVTEFFTGLLVLTPYRQWRQLHAGHHATAADLDRRGTGDVWTMTVQEYLEASRWRRLAYRFVRNPFVLFVLGPAYVFVIEYRVPSRSVSKRIRRGVYMTNAALLAVTAVMALTVGIKTFLLVQLPITMMAGTAGIWLFYVQHQFESVYWERKPQWDYVSAALHGSSFYKLPRVLQWFSGNIGFHHIHHLSPAIPNYRLERCHRENTLFQAVPPVTFWASLKALSFRLWDERRQRLVGYSRVRVLRRAQRLGVPSS